MTKQKLLIQISRTLKNHLQQNIFSSLSSSAYTSISQSFMNPLVNSFHAAAPLALTIFVIFSTCPILAHFPDLSVSVHFSYIDCKYLLNE